MKSSQNTIGLQCTYFVHPLEHNGVEPKCRASKDASYVKHSRLDRNLGARFGRWRTIRPSTDFRLAIPDLYFTNVVAGRCNGKSDAKPPL
jgi:hypothetical protein